MKIPTLTFEVDYLTNFFKSENKLEWLLYVFALKERELTATQILSGFEQQQAVIQISICVLIIMIFINIWAVYTTFSKFSLKVNLGRLAFLPLTIPLGYYFTKVLYEWFTWLTTFGWWFFIPLFLSTGAFIGIILLIIKYTGK